MIFGKLVLKFPPPRAKSRSNTPSQVHFRRRRGFKLSAGSRPLDKGEGGGRSSRPLDKGGPVFQKKFFRAPGPQSGLKIRGELGPLPCIRHCFPTLMHRNQIPHLPEDYDFQIPFTGEVKDVNSLAQTGRPWCWSFRSLTDTPVSREKICNF